MPDFTDRNLGLWALHMRLDGPDTLVRVDPRHATGGHEAHHVTVGDDDTPGLLFVWKGVRVPDARDADSLYVVQLVTLRQGDRDARWWTWVGRESGASASIDFVDSPRLHVIGPVAPEPGESHLAAQKRSRVLVPVSTNFELGVSKSLFSALAYSDSCAPLYFWARDGSTNLLAHPNEQHQQFAALFATDSRDAASFRHVLYLATEDDEGYIKLFHHEGFTVSLAGTAETPGDDPVACFGWAARYVAGYEDALARLGADDGEVRHTRYGNTFHTPYPAVTGAFVAKTDDIWYDVAERYREFIAGSRMWDAPIAVRTDRADIDRGAPWLGAIDAGDTPDARENDRANRYGAPIYADFLATARAFQVGLRVPGLPESRCFLHSQNFRRDGYSARTTDHPVFEGIDHGLEAISRMALDQGITFSVHTGPADFVTVTQPRFLRMFPAEAFAYDRNGMPAVGPQYLPFSSEVPAGGEPYARTVDHGSPLALPFYMEHLYIPLVVSHGFLGIYTDVFSGTGADAYFDPPPPLLRQHVANGSSSYVAGKRRLIRAIRALLREHGAPGQYFTVGEGCEEFLQDGYEVANTGYQLHASHQMIAEPRFAELLGEAEGFAGVPRLCRQMNPPLWNAVHHEWAPAQRQGMAFSNAGLASNRRFRGSTLGLSPEEFLDIHCFVMALQLGEGGHPHAMIHYRHDDAPLWRLAPDGETPVVDRDVDPTGVGLEVLALMRHLVAHLRRGMGKYTLRGRMERPLQRGDPTDEDSRTSPVSLLNPLLGRVTQAQVATVGPVLYTFDPYFAGLIDFPVFDVLHSVWSSVEVGAADLGIVLSNWTGDVARFAAVLDPELYGIDVADRYRIRGVDEHGRVAWETGELRGVVEIATHGATGDWPVVEVELPPRRTVLLEVVVS